MRSTKFLALVLSTSLLYSGPALAASEQTTTESQPGATAPGGTPPTGKKRTPPLQPTASITLDCGGGKKFKVSTGTNTGNCNASGNAAMCVLNGQQVALAKCPNGCDETAGSGSCEPVN
jgi:hypothetical protein